ncbi:Serine/threonine protein kinase PrkC, regulator of stationary phase [Labilithrix luteola]|uniref:Serine/threonine protein kinase PrkC, regulator of stationary phase n=2 Tax=Labilithrix luteola TaxID=1391654 RepID=A0A0K1PS77_9BACT|nr:Serine/threonine protein kinase PrkC, regulator of stationary phase [Labilithrix luteola]
MPKVGDVIAGKYRLDKVAGEGGMGVVYAATHLVLKQTVAVKVLLPSAATSEAVVERFAREAQAAARIQSEHVARVMDAGSLASGAPFLVMEFLDGCDLEELLQLQGKLPLADVADYLLQALEALAHAHAVGIVHRDLKPANLFLACRPDGSNAIKMLDFGISKAMTSRPEDKVLTGQAVLGSPVYMSPEQLRNAKEIDSRADLWSLGVVTYELLSGAPPFDGDGVGEIFAAILEKDPTPLHELVPSVPKEFSDIVAKCLERKVEDRWPSAAELASAVAKFGTGAHADVVSSCAQVLTRSKMLHQHTPAEVRRVADAIAAAAERARSTSLGTEPLLLANRKPESATVKDGLRTRALGAAWRMPSVRWMGIAAALMVVIGAFAIFFAVRVTRDTTAAPQTTMVSAAEGATPQDPSSDEGEGASGQGDGNAPMLMDLPETPGQKGTAQRSRGGKGQRPQRPKFLNTRE